MKMTSVLLGAALVSWLTGCATPQVVMPTVGPNPAGQANSSTTGQLEVFSALQLHRDGPEFQLSPGWYQHTDYNVYTMDGRRVRHVSNSVGHYEQVPAVISLPVGKYFVMARAQDYLSVKTPVVIEPGLTTRVHLDDKWQPPQNVNPSEVVRVPGGHPIGWRAAAS